jgi:hypothetical protein
MGLRPVVQASEEMGMAPADQEHEDPGEPEAHGETSDVDGAHR